MSRGKAEEHRYRRYEHIKSCNILMNGVIKKLGLELDVGDLFEVFRLAFASRGGYTEKDAVRSFQKWIEEPNDRVLDIVVENFCLDIMSNRIGVIPRKKAKNKLKGGTE